METSIVEWKNIPWRKLEGYVFKLQNQLFKASQEGNAAKVRKIQKLLMRSKAAKYIAVRQVTQDNQGRHTAGVDGIRSLRPEERQQLAEQTILTNKAKPTRRVWIPKPNSEEKRPLGIPTIEDRATQTLVKIALEPEWEAKFEPNSYGFRPGRSAHDAIGAIFSNLQRPKYILDADITKCFDKINHDALLTKLNTFPTLKRVVKQWLKAGVMDGKTLFKTDEGTPQGGVISPLLANIALHGLETYVNTLVPRIRSSRKPGQTLPDRQTMGKLIRYADDFVVIHEDLNKIQEIKAGIEQWLAPMGLTLKPSKTRITHSLHKHEGNVGFDFLGFTIRQYPVGYHRSKPIRGKYTTARSGFKTLIMPSKAGLKRHYDKIAKIIDAHKALPQEALILRLNPIIRGWSYYYRTVVSARAFSRLDDQIHDKLWRWAKRRHSGKSRTWLKDRYWPRIGNRKWNFAASQQGTQSTLLLHSETKITRHVQVKGEKSPFDGDWIYWTTRLAKSPNVRPRVAMLMKKQQGKCTLCGLHFKEGDVMEVDHIEPIKRKGGDRNHGKERQKLTQLQLLHKHCHIRKTSADRANETKLGNTTNQ